MTAQELKDKYESDLIKLQETCKHEDIHDWAEERWRAESTTGREVKWCKNCWKTLEIRGKYHWEIDFPTLTTT